ncbi:MAG: hypothetical protein WDM81_04470 [Rhizomicrobium sp.]
MDLAERRHRIQRRALHARAVGDVHEARRGFDLLARQLLRRGLGGGKVDVGNHDVHAGTAEGACHAQADAARAARD